MFKNYFKIGFRNILKHKGYAFINMSGLAIGIACCLLIFIYVKDELTYDRYHSNGDRIHRIYSRLNFGGSEMTTSSTSVIGPKAFADEIPEIEVFARVGGASAIVQHNDDYIDENGLLYADKSLFEIFDFEVVDGSLNGVLSELNDIVLTREIAEKYFGRTDVVGELLKMRLSSEFESYKIAAVIENHPANSSFNFEIVMPWTKYESTRSAASLNSWGSLSIGSYVMLSEAADVAVVADKMEKVRFALHPDTTSFVRRIQSELQPLADVHLNTEINSGPGFNETSDPVYSYVLSGIAFLILIIACINFTNLSVAQSLPRAREIGVRKVVGAVKSQLATQFLLETFLMCTMAFVVGMMLAEFSMPLFGSLTEKQFQLSLFDDPLLLISAFSIVLLTAFISGFYPAFIVSRFNVVKCLKGGAAFKGKKYVTRGLVVVQFAIATVLIIGALTMRGQINHMINQDLGYDDQYLYRVSATGFDEDKGILKLFKGELAANPNIIGVGGSTGYGSANSLVKENGDEFFTAVTFADQTYLDVKQIELVEGRYLASERDITIEGEDTLRNVLVNEAFIKEQGWEDALSQRVEGYRVVGVIKDYNFSSARSRITPLMIHNFKADESFASQILVKFNPEYLPEVKQALEAAWRKFVPYYPFYGDLLSESNKNLYRDEVRWNKIISAASTLAILISCMGLLGLAHLATQQRIKEIGVRKVLGASIAQILLLLNSSFVKLILISIVLAVPVAYFAISQWLDNFAAQINISLWLFLLPGLIILAISFLTVTIQSLKHANANPVNSLRYE